MPINGSQIKLLESIWRNSTSGASNALTESQKRFTQGNGSSRSANNKQSTVPNGKNSRKTKSKPSRPKKKVQQPQADKVPKRKRGAGKTRGTRPRGMKGYNKPSTSANISKFNGGVKGSRGATIATAAKVAVTTGTSKLSLGGALANSSFLAGANSVPHLLLFTANFVVWKDNLKKIANIYRGGSDFTLDFIPRTQRVVSEAIPPFEGGQDPNRIYNMKYHSSSGIFYKSQPAAISSPIQAVSLNVIGYGEIVNGEYSGERRPISVNVIDGTGELKNWLYITGATYFKVLGFYPSDGQPDTGGDPPGGIAEVTTSEGVSNDAIGTVEPTDRPSKPKPPKKVTVSNSAKATGTQDTSEATSTENVESNSKVEPVPETVPEIEPLPTDNTDTQPKSPTDSPVVETTDKTIPATNKKPKTNTKTTYYPDSLPFTLPGTQLIRNTATGVNTRVTRRYGANKVPEGATEVTTSLPPVIPPAIPKPALTQKFESPAESPKVTPVNKCKKGCGGASDGNSSPEVKDGVNQINTLLQGLDLGLLTKIDTTTTATKNAVTHASYGLEAVQNFAQKAWSFTKADKIINGLGTIASIHNAAMLSQDVGQTLGDAASGGLNLLNIKDAEGESIDVNSAIGGAIKNIINSTFPEAATKLATSLWLQLNRIHQAVGSTVSAIQGTKNALLEADEITGGHVAEIGNALQDQGIIEEGTYDFMNTAPDYKTPFKGVLGKIEDIQNIGDRVSQVVSTGLEIKDSSTELITTSDELNQATQDFLTGFTSDRDAKITASQSPTIDRLDLLKTEPDEV